MADISEKISNKFKELDNWSHLNKLSLILVIAIFATIPVIVFGVVTLRQIDPQAASGQPTSLSPSGTSSTIDPIFSWSCYCYTTLYRVQVREDDGNFWSGSWYKDVTKGSSDYSSTTFTGFSSFNNYKDGSPIPGSMTPGKTYFWNVSCITGGCTTSSTKSFSVVVEDTRDSDSDGFNNTKEGYIGTNPNWLTRLDVNTVSFCGVNAWPPDFNNDRVVNPGDQAKLSSKIGTSDRRYDLNTDGSVNLQDQTVLMKFLGKSCNLYSPIQPK